MRYNSAQMVLEKDKDIDVVDQGVIRVLLVEDDARLAHLTATYLQMRGLLVTIVSDGPSGLQEVLRNTYDVVLLDLLLPGRDGLDVCREIRARLDIPIIMVTACGDEGDRVVGLESGADDYVSKPFSSPELLARIRTAVRRYRGQLGPPSRTVTAGRLFIDPSRLHATFDDRNLDLTAYDLSILRVLAENAGRVLSREQLLDMAKGSAEEAFDRSIDGHISKLRKKLDDDPKRPRIIKTVRGMGYMLVVDREQ